MPKKLNEKYKEELFEQEFGSDREDENSRLTLKIMIGLIGVLIIAVISIIILNAIHNRALMK